MSSAVFLMVLTAAFLHAAWNILLKSAGNGETAMCALTLTYAAAGAAMIPFAGAPSGELIPILALSALLHAAYNLALVRAYREGDFSRAYPVSRGSAPLLAALAAAVFLGEEMRAAQWGGMALAACGVISLSLGRRFHRGQTAVALGVGALIAAYSATDAAGVRLAEKSAGGVLTYIAWAFVLDGAAYWATTWARRGRGMLASASRADLQRGVVCGALAFAAYCLALLAYARAPVGVVAAVREVSIVIGAFYGALVLREGMVARRTFSAAVAAAGLGILLTG